MSGVSLSESPSPRRVCIFCGSSFGTNPVYRDAAESFARLLAENGIAVVYGGASVGLMGAVADAALAAGGEVIGVLPRSMMAREIGHSGLTELHLVETLHERKAMMAELSGAFVALPGGWGTFEEMFEALSWAQIGLHRKPCALLNTDGFYDALLSFLETAVTAGFVRPESSALLLSDSDPAILLNRLRGYVAPVYDRWSGNAV
ncbi:MAG: TIGR00730 family Rossman fold protein [Akkermansiaceae bacterium]|nr:TIGR00730 family Rossman fold protein [Armatimonadota bacterium]